MSTKGSVLITGCSDGGIGSGLALVFQQRGYHVFATARNPGKMAALRNLPNVTLLTLDVTNKSDIQATKDLVDEETGGTLSYLINNAGRNHFMPLLDDDVDIAKRIFDINVWGPLTVTQAFAPLLIKSQGMLVNITSIAGHGPVPTMGSYSASKRSLEIMSEVLRLELTPFNVKVLSVVTGAVSTNGQTYLQDWTLPANSLYKPVEETLAHTARGTDGIPRMPLMEYATKVVDGILQGETRRIWVGAHAEMAKNTPSEGEMADKRDQFILESMTLNTL
ncbi:hypothetical protein N7462_007499 [Penicillium macrosclerotiorum]|uniref:uncharacterized protein n=1 Tax=Penicillium macrosclerotiorum TaxID=303699 RepID=UPI0025478D20|nr:uncharacterized protein N7462_007499 [Penicillium macrosclerotiorum]KAJ5679255.1 hypothetical protein N7462_007499 [Penicillium macrosclerotiorum]